MADKGAAFKHRIIIVGKFEIRDLIGRSIDKHSIERFSCFTRAIMHYFHIIKVLLLIVTVSKFGSRSYHFLILRLWPHKTNRNN
jgi:hypothetical protein